MAGLSPVAWPAPDRPALAAVTTLPGGAPGAILEAALADSLFWQLLERRQADLGAPPDELRIVVKPDICSMLDRDAPTGTSPALVEHLLALLHRRGYTQTTIVESLNALDRRFENRDPLVVADLVGYRFKTADGVPYDVVDLNENTVAVESPAGSTLSGSELARAWAEADFRILFAKNRTDAEHGYALCVWNLLGVLPRSTSALLYRAFPEPGGLCVDLLMTTPVHFALIDAVVSNHGSAGLREIRPLRTDTVIGSADAVLADWAAAAKMGTDPYVSTLNGRVLREIGLPPNYQVRGDLSP
jgi:uncharacterized protein (DUF362 family)